MTNMGIFIHNGITIGTFNGTISFSIGEIIHLVQLSARFKIIRIESTVFSTHKESKVYLQEIK